MDAIEAIRTRRSLRQLAEKPVAREVVDEVLELACLAPAPHHTRPWRYVVVSHERRGRVAEAMGSAWRSDLERDRHPADLIERLLRRSSRQILTAPVLILACLTHEGLRAWPDQRRQRNEWAMAQQSIGAAMENLMLGAHARGLASYWISAPLWSPEAVREALELPEEFVAQAFVVLGYPAGEPHGRTAVDSSKLVVER